jgi:hypothetical protein
MNHRCLKSILVVTAVLTAGTVWSTIAQAQSPSSNVTVFATGLNNAVEPNRGELDAIWPDGEIHRVADISATQGHIVPTAVAYQGNSTWVIWASSRFKMDPRRF